jgi:hypothetical protein
MSATWTIAYRKPRANRFQRATNWAGTWHEAYEMAARFGTAHPELQVFYVPTPSTEAANPGHEDNGNILVETGRRVRMVNNGTIEDALIPTRTREVQVVSHAAAVKLVMDQGYARSEREASDFLARLKSHGLSRELGVLGRSQVSIVPDVLPRTVHLVLVSYAGGDLFNRIDVTLTWGQDEPAIEAGCVVEFHAWDEDGPVIKGTFKYAATDADPYATRLPEGFDGTVCILDRIAAYHYVKAHRIVGLA